MKITLAGSLGSGKSSLRSQLAAHYGLVVKATGDFMRQTAKKYGFQDITQFLVEYVSSHPEVDHEVDEEQRHFGETYDNFVLDAHLGFYFVPDSIKICLTCDPRVAAERIFAAKRETESAQDLDAAVAANQKRSETMRRNFWNLYKVDLTDHSQFDYVLDTTNLDIDTTFDKVKDFIDQH